MRIKVPQNTIFGKHAKKITVENFKKRAQYYFTGDDLEKVTSVSVEKKTSKYWVTVVTPSGEYIEKINFHWNNSNLVVYDYDSVPLFYDIIASFVKDFQKSTEDDFRILNGYKESLRKKEMEMKDIMDVQSKIHEIAPEYFL